VVADLRHGEFVAQVTGAVLEDQLQFAAMQVIVEIRGDGELEAGVLQARGPQSGESKAQVRHDPEVSF
jgi:hypothetical protein